MLLNPDVAKVGFPKVYFFFPVNTDRSHEINQSKRNPIIWTSDIDPFLLKNWNDGIEFNHRDLDGFRLQREKACFLIRQVLQYIASTLNASNPALRKNADYLFSAIDVDFNVKWIGESGTRVNRNKFNTTY